jgi:RNA polymerase sigma-70 factor, ECF subfamily
LNTDSERILLNEIKLNPHRFGALYDEYYEPIFSYIFRRLGNYELTRDIASDTFMKAYLKIHAFEWKGVSIAYWFFRIATNEINLYFRSNKYTSQFLQNAIDKNAFDFVHAPAEEEREIIENELKRHEEFIDVQTALKCLKICYQEVIALKYFEQKSIKEIAIILNKKEGTIKSLLSRGIEKLKNLL